MKCNVNVDIPLDLTFDLDRYGQRACYRLAEMYRDDIVKDYRSIVTEFYNEYEPHNYVRHHDRPEYTLQGLMLTYDRVLQPTTQGYVAGIMITPNHMYNDYHDPETWVLDSFLAGYHGRSIHFGMYPLVQIEDELRRQPKVDHTRAAIRYANSALYKVLKVASPF